MCLIYKIVAIVSFMIWAIGAVVIGVAYKNAQEVDSEIDVERLLRESGDER